HQSAVGHLSPFIHECRTYYLNSRTTKIDKTTQPTNHRSPFPISAEFARIYAITKLDDKNIISVGSSIKL
ncbi:hypothetical protein ACLHZT_21765, partial [Aeromonas veronii]|uniref:hypothetical protein n=1 Tax=Aeromonas veronii TaxID=654 RepID=UPI003D05C1A9